MPFCPHCGSQIPDNAAFCGACGKGTSAAPPPPQPPMAPPPYAAAPNMGLADNVAGMLAYLTIIPAIVFLVVEPYNRKPFIRFHAFQSIFLCVAWIILSVVVSFVPFMWFFMHTLLWLAMLVLWIIVMLKAYQGQMFKLPVIGDLAAKQAGSM